MAKKTYQVASPIRHDGKEYGVGEPIDLEDKEAEDLLAVKAIERGAVSAAGNTLTAPADDAERIVAIVSAIGQLDANDKALWAKSGAPKTEPIAAITGWPVAAADRDAAWAQINAAQ
jgi:hypothetical protein